jgi:ribonuclease-3
MCDRSLEESLGYEFRSPGLLEAALTHASALPPGVIRACERLEFLGDAVLDLAIADLLLENYPGWDEGRLSKVRARLVQTSSLAAKGRELGLDRALRLGRGEERSGGRRKASILAAVYEAVLGAVFKDGGYSRARSLVARHFAVELMDRDLVGSEDWKTMLQEHTQERYRIVPEYRVVEERGPAHAREFTTEVWVQGTCVGCGEGGSKREAEQQAARVALERLSLLGE